MKKKENEEMKKVVPIMNRVGDDEDTPDDGGCEGLPPSEPGGTGAGDWACRGGKWQWIQDIGG